MAAGWSAGRFDRARHQRRDLRRRATRCSRSHRWRPASPKILLRARTSSCGSRLFHPGIAIAGIGFLLFAVGQAMQRIKTPVVQRLGLIVMGLALLEVMIGAMNLAVLAPVAMQLLHLAGADVLWIAAVLFSAAASGGHELAVRTLAKTVVLPDGAGAQKWGLIGRNSLQFFVCPRIVASPSRRRSDRTTRDRPAPTRPALRRCRWSAPRRAIQPRPRRATSFRTGNDSAPMCWPRSTPESRASAALGRAGSAA